MPNDNSFFHRRWLLISTVLALCVASVAMAFYVLHLDNTIRQRFAGSRWALPAQIFASPLELHAGATLARDELVTELRRLGYRTGQLDRSGSFRTRPHAVELHTRAFEYWDGPQSAGRFRIDFQDSVVREISAIAGGSAPPILRLDPLLIGSIFPGHGEDRVLLRIADAPPLLLDGLVRIEDQRFYTHLGLDPRSIVRAALANLRSGSVVQGGSTLTQQLIKNFFLSNERSYRRKLNEAIYALLVEFHYSKDEILEAYLNEIYLGQDGDRAIHGFGLASQYYFRKPLAELEDQELALLVAMVKGPSYYDPRRHAARARERRDSVLLQWQRAGLIDEQRESRARMAQLGVVEKASLGQARFPAFVDLVRKELREEYDERDLTHEGLRIFTTLDPRLQSIAEQELASGLGRVEQERSIGQLQGAVILASVTDGSVLALVGGRDAGYAGFNRALDASRPAGSLIKPAVYLAALRQPQRWQLTTALSDTAVRFEQANGEVWAPQNYDLKEHGQVPLYRALVKSYNLATVNLALELGLESVVASLRDLGLERDPPPLPSLSLGAIGMSTLEVAQIYGTLAAGGFRSPLRSIREVLTRESVPLRRYPLEVGRPLDPGALYLLDWTMKQVTQQGTGRGVFRSLDAGLQVAGKTGTTDELRDSWFAGYGGNYQGVVWVGRDDNTPAGLTGASGALPIWARIMARAGLRSASRGAPDGIVWARVDIDSHLPAPRGCRRILRMPFMDGHVPTELAPCAKGRRGPLRFIRDLFQ